MVDHDRLPSSVREAARFPWMALAVCAIASTMLALAAIGKAPFAFEVVRHGGLPTGWLSLAESYRLVTYPFAPLDSRASLLELVMVSLLLADLERRTGWRFTVVLVVVAMLATAVTASAADVVPGVLAGIASLGYAAFAARLTAAGVGPNARVGPVALPMALGASVVVLVHLVFAIVDTSSYRSMAVYGIAAVVGAVLGAIGRRFDVPRSLAAGLLALSLGSFLALGLDSARSSARQLAERWLESLPSAALALDVGQFVAADATAPRALLERAFAALSDIALPDYASSLEGNAGLQRADTLSVLAWRAGMLGEARGHGLDAALRARGAPGPDAPRVLARLAIYEKAARLPQFVPAAVLVRANTLCVIIPEGNARQFVRAVASQRLAGREERILGILLGTVDSGETRCIPAAGVPAEARVAITAAERAVLTADLRYHAVVPADAALLPRG